MSESASWMELVSLMPKSGSEPSSLSTLVAPAWRLCRRRCQMKRAGLFLLKWYRQHQLLTAVPTQSPPSLSTHYTYGTAMWMCQGHLSGSVSRSPLRRSAARFLAAVLRIVFSASLCSFMLRARKLAPETFQWRHSLAMARSVSKVT